MLMLISNDSSSRICFAHFEQDEDKDEDHPIVRNMFKVDRKQ